MALRDRLIEHRVAIEFAQSMLPEGYKFSLTNTDKHPEHLTFTYRLEPKVNCYPELCVSFGEGECCLWFHNAGIHLPQRFDDVTRWHILMSDPEFGQEWVRQAVIDCIEFWGKDENESR